MSNALALRDNFQNVLNEVAFYFQQLGVNVRAFDDDDDLSTVPADVLVSALEQMENFAATLREIPVKEYNDKKFLRLFLKRQGLRVAEESSFDLMHEEHVVEIYNKEVVQVFRNKKFMEVCSYSLSKIMTTPGYELFYRDPSAIEVGYREFLEIMETPVDILVSKTPEHILWEIQKEPCRALLLHQHYMIKVFQGDETRGVLAFSSGCPVSETTLTPFFAKNGKMNDVLSKLTPEEIRKFQRSE